MKILWSPLAIDRALEIASYIAQDKPSAAEKWINTIFSKVEQLKSYPEIDRVVPEVKNDQIRELIYDNYRIIYRLEKKQISIQQAQNSFLNTRKLIVKFFNYHFILQEMINRNTFKPI